MNIPRIRRPLRQQLPILLVILAGTAISVFVFAVKRDATAERQRSVFSEMVHAYDRGLRQELDLTADVVHTMRDFMLASPGVDREAFASFARASLERRPALTVLQWMPRVPAEAVRGLEAAAREEGIEDFAVTELVEGEGIAPAGPRPVYYPVFYVEPLEANRAAVGFDYASDPRRLEALRQAAEGGRMVATEPLQTIVDAEGEARVLLLLPVFAPGEREPAGFVAGALDPAAIARELRPVQHLLRAELSDQTVPAEAKHLFQVGDVHVDEAATHKATFPLSIGGRKWVLELHAQSEALAPRANLESWGFLIGSLLLTFFTAAWIRQRQDYTYAIEEQVNERTAALTRINQSLQDQVQQRQQIEEKLLQSEAVFREAFHHAPIGIGLLTPEGRWIQVNDALAELIGRTPADLIDRPFQEVLHPDDAEREIAQFAQILAEQAEVFSIEQRFRHAGGGAVWVLMNVSQVREGDGRLLYFICQILDITDRKEALEETRQAKEFSENIIRSSQDGIVAFDREGAFTVWNSGMEKMTGIAASAALGRPVVRVLPFLAEAQESRSFKRVLAGATVKATDRPFLVESSGRSGFYEAHYSPLHDTSGGIIGGVGVIRDVTEQKNSRERLQNFTALLRQRNRELQDFAYVASHDLQEPLRKIRAFGDRLQKRCEHLLDEQAKDYLGRMQDAARRMQVLISDLLSFSRVSTEAQPFAEVDLTAVARDVISDLEERIEQSGAQVELGELPRVQADPTQMRQLLQNLISNGLKYQKPGTPPRIEISATEYMRETDLPPLEHHGCLIHVRDNGIGFDEKYLDRIFTVFQRLHGRNEYEGTGIGLAICRKIVERHHGWITARSSPGHGATFIAGLPYRQNNQ